MSRKLAGYLFALIMVLLPFDFNTFLTCCSLFSSSLGVALQTTKLISE